MSFDKPTANRSITSRNPIAPARSMTLNGTGRPRTFSTRLQKMWPPSRGRNGNRLMTASERLITAISVSASRSEPDRLPRHLVAPHHPGELLALLGSKMRAITPTVWLVTSHMNDAESPAASATPG